MIITDCEDGKWGENCDNTCRCLGREVCDKISGKCPGGRCEPPFTGESCQVNFKKYLVIFVNKIRSN